MKISYALGALFGLGSGLLLLGLLGFRFNLSSSLPPGVYRVVAEPAMRGSVVQLCLPVEVAEFARRRGYLGPGSCAGGVRPLGKIVLAIEGDVVVLSRDQIRVNGEAIPNSVTVSNDSRGRHLPHFAWGVHRLRRGELWLFSPYHRAAYDSRYFGPVRTAQVVSVLQPIWLPRRAGKGRFWWSWLNDLRVAAEEPSGDRARRHFQMPFVQRIEVPDGNNVATAVHDEGTRADARRIRMGDPGLGAASWITRHQDRQPEPF